MNLPGQLGRDQEARLVPVGPTETMYFLSQRENFNAREIRDQLGCTTVAKDDFCIANV